MTDTPEMVERITGVAVLCRGVPAVLPEPYRHYHVLRVLDDLGEDMPGPRDQGFFTSRGRFLEREPAKAVAIAAGQYRPTVPGGLRELYSEDLW